jgi:Sugar (and other) transporter
MCPFLPDSPRLLIRKGKYDEAYEVLAALEGHGATVNSPSVRTQFSIIKDVLDREYKNTYTWWQLITGKGPSGVVRRMILVSYIHAGSAITNPQ